MNYDETIGYLYSRLPMFHRDGSAALKPGLEHIIRLCNKLGDPHKEFRSIHIAGTNGKGSTSNFLASIFQEAGYKTGLFTSPHLKDFRERIRINGEMILESEVVMFVNNHKAEFETIDASFFEYTTAMAFWYFAKEKVDIAIIETGLGGRLDSTNILQPELCVITSVSLDHSYLLGNTVEQIAAEKAGIIKRGVPVVLAPNTPEVYGVIEYYAKMNAAALHSAAGLTLLPGLEPGLHGDYQSGNVKTVLKTIEILEKQGWEITNDAISNGLKNVVRNTGFRGRWEIISHLPDVICDVAHNEDGIRWVMRQLSHLRYETLHIVFGMVKDKAVESVLALLPAEAKYYFSNAAIPRAMPAAALKDAAAKYGLVGESYETVHEAFEEARRQAKKEDVIFVGGSVFVVAEVLP